MLSVPMGHTSECRGESRSVQLVLKRGFDIVVAAAALILLSPLMTLACLAIRLNSSGPVFVSPVQYCYNNRRVHIITFRCCTMEDADTSTSVGRILSRSGIDQIPMFINVLRGEMSIVGHRTYVAPPSILLAGIMPDALRRSKLKPGVLCRASLHSWTHPSQQIEDDLFYTENWSLLLDLEIIIRSLTSKASYTVN